jgi:tRNA (guanine37-N1)-methyltransferase
MKFNIYTLYPQLFESFLSTSLIARGIDKEVIKVNLIDWRKSNGKGAHKQVDDKPFGGGSGMVLQCEPIFQCLQSNEGLGAFVNTAKGIIPNNSKFYELNTTQPQKKVTISMTPKGFPITQDILYWLADFEELNILCGRFEGFDERVNTFVDCELSLGDFVLNGGEVPAMALIEGVSRLTEGFITKSSSVDHDSFSIANNYYKENSEYSKIASTKTRTKTNLFDDQWWLSRVESLEHPVYTRPATWNNYKVPELLLNGDHKLIQKWQLSWFNNLT